MTEEKRLWQYMQQAFGLNLHPMRYDTADDEDGEERLWKYAEKAFGLFL